ncbi:MULTISPECIES: DUF6766 family protein [unclassified Lysobacter]|nr:MULTISPECIES: DUF6766 family protein [unclassified Lysobacter]MBT2744929.1 hypothetical protein [Lysobacter sp. ISL-42]MBT2752078.1 hypothetical protein [Lysobacter sp. ISL-50]MBT2778575.1 hypothetical protein [Lysobacter sp. ISL-54]MBT2780494.1 hypothetical protein [Lysobacter sp. ISL-52]
MRSGFWRENALSMVLLILFASCLFGQIASGRAVFNQERREHGLAPVAWIDYFHHGQFVSATFENWESEFLQMGLYVLLTVGLRQKGSAESRPLDDKAQGALEADSRDVEAGPSPSAVRRGGWIARLYANSLSISLLLLFAVAFAAHGYGSWRQEVEERSIQGQAAPTLPEHLAGAEFWFESFQNWQSEFLAVLALVVLSIWLRQAHSPQSKPVRAPHSQTGAG